MNNLLVANSADSSVVSVANTSTAVLAASNNRIGVTLSNASDEAIDISFGEAASTGQGVRLSPNTPPWNVPVMFQGLAVNAICASGSKNLAVQVFELVPPSPTLHTLS